MFQISLFIKTYHIALISTIILQLLILIKMKNYVLTTFTLLY